MYKKHIFFISIIIHLFFIIQTHSQNVGISNSIFIPHSSAGLDVSFTDKGILIPRVSLMSINDVVTIPIPELSLLVFNTGSGGLIPAGYYYWNGTQWTQLIESAASSSDPSWLLEGNAATIAGTAISENFVGTTDQQDLILATNRNNMLHLKWGGSIRMFGDFENQELKGSLITYGDPAITDPPAISLAGGPNASTLWIAATMLVCPACNNPYSQELPNTNGFAEVIDGSVQSITITDGSGPDNSGVLVLANVVIKTISNGTLPNAFRYALWVQRSTDPTFDTNTVNVYKIEDAVATGTTVGGNTGPGISLSTIVYPDLMLDPGTYYYRIVYQTITSSAFGITPYAQDRSMVLMQIKR